MTCIGNSGPLPEEVVGAIEKVSYISSCLLSSLLFPPCTLVQGELIVCGVLSGNRNFEGRINPHTPANYLASPLLCIAYAIAGTVSIDFENESIGKLEWTNR